MGKAAKSKREEQAEKEDAYKFELPKFDEQAFVRRELSTAKASFYTLALGMGAGLIAVLLYPLPVPWYTGWAPLLLSLLAVRPMLTRLGFGPEITAARALIGSYFMLFLTGLAVWILGVNLF